MRALGNRLLVAALTLGLIATSCGSDSNGGLSEAESTTASPPTDAKPAAEASELAILVPDGWTTVTPEADAEESPDAEPPAGMPDDVVCPDGSAPRAPLENLQRIALASAPAGAFVVFQTYEYESEAAALDAIALWGPGKCEVVVGTTDGESPTFTVYVDERANVSLPAELVSVAVLMTPEDGSSPNGVVLFASGNTVLLAAAVGGDGTQLEDVLNQVAAQY